MTQETKYSPGTFCWADLGVPDQKAGKAFYAELFGWTAVEVPMGPGGTYTMFQVDGKDVCAVHKAEQGLLAGKPGWLPYIAVDDVDRYARRAQEHWGKVLEAPSDASDAGRAAVVQDPSGAVVGLWQAKKRAGAGAMNGPGTLCWFELVTTNTDAAREFYATVFGHASTIHAPGPNPYVVLVDGKREVAGLMTMPREGAGSPSQWLAYFAVKDCDKTVKQAARLGGHVHVEPKDIPGLGRFAVIADPQGAVFSVLEPPKREKDKDKDKDK